MTDQEIDRYAKLVWDYLQVHQDPKPSEAIFCLGSINQRVASRTAELFDEGYGEYVIFSGNVGKLTEGKFYTSEAHTFAAIANRAGVPWNKIIIEDKSTNTGENVRFTHKLLEEKGLRFKALLLVQKPYMERRTYATFRKQWPDPETKFTVTSPRISYEDYFNENCPKQLVLNVMVGDMQRVKEYPKLGFQIEQPIPAKAWEAYEHLVRAGYTEHLL